MKVLILGVNGFIGSHLVDRIMADTDWEVYGLDLGAHKVSDHLANSRFHFVEGDVTISKEWIEYHIKKCDVVLPLVAIATPKIYVTDPPARLRAGLRGESPGGPPVRQIQETRGVPKHVRGLRHVSR